MLEYDDITYNGKSIDCLKYNNEIIWLKLIEQEGTLYIGTCLGNYLNTGLTAVESPNIECYFQQPKDNSDGVVWLGARDASGKGETKLAFLTSTNRVTARQYKNALGWCILVQYSHYSIATISNSKIAIAPDNIPGITSYNLISDKLTAATSAPTIVLFDIAELSKMTSLNKKLPGYIHSYKVTADDGTIKLHLIATLLNGVPCFKDEVSKQIFNIIGTNPIYYFYREDDSNIMTYNPS